MGSKKRAPKELCFSCTKFHGYVSEVCKFTFIAYVVKTIILVAVYFVFSIGLTFYQKWFIKKFKFPLSVVICHLVIKFVLAQVIRSFLSLCYKRDNIQLTWSLYVKQLLPPGLTSGLDIGLSNWSFEFITVSLYLMTKSSCIIFILLFAVLFGLEKLHYSLILIVSLISSGLFFFTYQAAQFNIEGFMLVLLASLMGGLRWTLTQMVTQKKELGLSNPLDMMYHIQPWMIITLLPLAVSLEGVEVVTSRSYFRNPDFMVGLKNGFLILIGAGLAFCMEFSEFLLITQTSSLTLNIAGIFKEVISLFLAHYINNDQMQMINFFGLIICLSGIILHLVFKIKHTSHIKTYEDHGNNTALPLLPHNEIVSDDEDVLYEKK